MECELKYMKYDFIKTIKRITLVYILKSIPLTIIVYSISYYLLGDIGLIICYTVLIVSIIILMFNKAKKKYCRSK